VAGGLLLFAAALLAKEPAVVLPPFLLALALLARDPRLRARPPVLAIFFAVLAAYFGLRALVLGAVAPGAGGGDLAARVGLVVGSVFESLRILALPIHLNASYAPAAIGFSPPKLAAVLAGLGALLWGALSRRSPDPLRAGCLWLLAGLLPIANLVPIPSAPVAERYLYVPALGFAVIGAALWRALATRRARLAVALAVALAAGLGVRAALRTSVWLDDRRLFESMVAADSGNASAHYNLGILRAGSGDLAGAIGAWEAAVAADPRHAGAHNNLGNAYAMTGRLESARTHYEAVRDLAPREAMPIYNLARVAELEGRREDAVRLYRDYARADAASPDPQRQALVARARSRAASLAGRMGPGPAAP
jgi:hypothetical protein